MDSPAARPTGEFHWGSTLWHELGHVITLGMTNNRVPRWFTEGLSVYEEGHARPGWGDPFDLGLIQALQKHGLVPIEKLDGVFVHPEYPNQVVFAYFQSGMICDFIVDRYGFPKILAMLRAYGDGEDDAGAIRAALGLSLTEFDDAFREYARGKTYGFGSAIKFERESPEEAEESDSSGWVRIDPTTQGDFVTSLRLANELRDNNQMDAALAAAEKAKQLFPPYVSEGNPYELLAGIYEQRGQEEKAAAELMEWRLQRGRNPDTFKKLADLLDQLGRRQEAIETLEEALQVSMYDIAIHQKLAEWSLDAGKTQEAVQEFRAVLALDPPDKAEAHYRLATAYQKLADPPSARREVLQALEIAPGYRPAQQLLLELAGQ
jgi:tetratricopeptide (TPR) repeat protein